MKEELTKQNDNVSVDSRKRISKVKVALTLGHSASHRAKTASSVDDFTHDWSFYVRGDHGCKIHHYIERVVFKLHESFKNPVQVIKKPPYEIHEQGYGTFILFVEVNFKNKRNPKQIEYKYDLVLPADGVPPINRARKEILTFTNPNKEFMTKLIDGGGALQHENLPSTSFPKQPAQIEPPRESNVSSPSVNKNREHTPKPSKEQEERRAAKDKRKEEKRKEKRAVEGEDEEEDDEDVRARKKDKRKEERRKEKRAVEDEGEEEDDEDVRARKKEKRKEERRKEKRAVEEEDEEEDDEDVRERKKEKRKEERRKEKRAVENEEEEENEEDVRVRKKEKKKERNSVEEEENVEQRPILQKEPDVSQGVVKDSKKHKKSSRPPPSATPVVNKDNKAERKPKSEDKQKQKISSVLAAIGDVESSDDENSQYFKESPKKEPIKHHEQTEPQSSKKGLSKPVQKEKPKRQKPEDSFLEFDSIDALKVKKKSKSKPEKTSGKIQSDSDRKPATFNKDSEKPRIPKTVKVEKETKHSKKYSSSNSDEDSKQSKQTGDTFLEFDNISTLKPKKKSHETPQLKSEHHETKHSKKYSSSNSDEDNRSAKQTDDTFMEFDNISTLKPKKKSHEKSQIKSEHHEKSKKREKDDDLIKNKESKKKDKSKHIKELKPETSRKRSSSLSSDTEDDAEEDGEIRTPSSDVDIDADEAEVARILSMEPEEKAFKEDERVPQKSKSKEKKNKHKALKKDPEAWRPYDIKDEGEEPPKMKSGGSSKFSTSPMQPDSSNLKQEKNSSESSASKQSKSSKPPEFHRSAPEHEATKPELHSPPSSSHMPDIPSPPLRQRVSSLDQEHTYRPDQSYSSEMVAPLRQEPSIMSPDHLRFMLNIYNKIHQLQKTDDKSAISEVVNILSTNGSTNMELKDENVTFDLVNCDLETLNTIDSVLS